VIDLHTHTLVSDGTDPPARVVDLAADVGCSALAVTDHDSFDGLAEARARAEARRLTLVPGCEVSCVPLGPGGLHVLVYFVDDGDSPLGEELGHLRTDRHRRNVALVDRLAELGVPVDYQQVVAGAGSEAGVGRPHFAAELVRIGAVDSMDEAFDRYLANGRPVYVSKARLTAGDVVDLAGRSGGVAVVAHPLSWGLEWHEMGAVVEELAARGLGGIECLYGRYSPDERQRLCNLADRLGLVATGGSDYHGSHKPDLSVGVGTGDLRVPDSVLDRLHERRPAA
jgi:predicted metal-dependent phosphoesterase TrpH